MEQGKLRGGKMDRYGILTHLHSQIRDQETALKKRAPRLWPPRHPNGPRGVKDRCGIPNFLFAETEISMQGKPVLIVHEDKLHGRITKGKEMEGKTLAAVKPRWNTKQSRTHLPPSHSDKSKQRTRWGPPRVAARPWPNKWEFHSHRQTHAKRGA